MTRRRWHTARPAWFTRLQLVDTRAALAAFLGAR